MNKSTYFSGQPVLSQIIQLMPRLLLIQLASKHKADHYYKTFKSYDHLIAMLYACFHNCTSLREVTTGLEASYNKLSHLGITNIPRRSTLADANQRRPVAFFEELYHKLYDLYYKSLPDSLRRKTKEERLFLMDSTTVTLFSDCMKGAGSPNADGRKKGGAKAHVLYKTLEALPRFIDITEGSRNDRVFMKKILFLLQKGDILVFDRGYHNYTQWQEWTENGIHWVTRLIGTEVYEVLEQRAVSADEGQKGVVLDQKIYLGRVTNPTTKCITVRLVTYYDAKQDRIFQFLANNFRFKASTIASLYKERWQVETFFKRFKQTSPVRYFLGDNENAIKIQLWCAFIKDLLIKVIKDGLKRKWAFANIASMIRHHLMNYIDVFKFLNNPEKVKAALYDKEPDPQLLLFVT